MPQRHAGPGHHPGRSRSRRQGFGNVQHMFQRLMIMPFGPIHGPFEHVATHLREHLRQQQGADFRDKEPGQVGQLPAKPLPGLETLLAGHGVGVCRGHQQYLGIVLDAIDLVLCPALKDWRRTGFTSISRSGTLSRRRLRSVWVNALRSRNAIN